MVSPSDVHALPGFTAIDALAVLKNGRHGASVQITDSYFDGQQNVLEAEAPGLPEERVQVARTSQELWDEIHIDFESLTERNLRDASDRFRDILQRLPEIQYLKRNYPETCFVVPEWLRTPGRVKYGARVYFFADDAPSPEDVIRRNIEATVNDTREEFERYQGRLHGYPECCIEYFQGASRTAGEDPPEYRSIAPLEDRVNERPLQQGTTPSTSLDEILPDFFDTPHGYAFFAHEFYPEPGCETARKKGVTIYELLVEILPESLVRDYFRVNFGWSYLMAESVRTQKSGTPKPGSFGREHLLSYLPLGVLLRRSRYRSTADQT